MRDINRKIPLIIIFASTILTLGIVELVAVKQSNEINSTVDVAMSTIDLKNDITELYNKLTSLHRAVEGHSITKNADYKVSGATILGDINLITERFHDKVDFLHQQPPSVASTPVLNVPTKSVEISLHMQVNKLNEHTNQLFGGVYLGDEMSVLEQITTIKEYCLNVLSELDTDILTQITVVGAQSNNVKISAIIGSGVGVALAIFLLWIVISQKRMHHTNEAQLEMLLYYDQLTSLPNRRMIFDEQTTGHIYPPSNTYVATCMIDIDRFSDTNDTIGHYNGDDILTQLAHRMIECNDQVISVARFGGDEFIVVYDTNKVDYIDAIADTELFGDAFIEQISAPFKISNMPFEEYTLSFSVGISIVKYGQEYADIPRRIKEADIALYHSKSTNRGAFTIFSDSMEKTLQRQITIERNMKEAITQNKIQFNYQPIVKDGVIIGAESLLSWTDTETDIDYNHEEITRYVDRLRLSTQLGYANLEVVCKQLREWINKKIVGDDFTVSVNVSGQQIKDPNFVSSIECVTQKYNIPYSRIRLEVADGVAFNEMRDTLYKLRTMKDLGVTVTLDDFGSGFTSLTHVKNLPITDIKICKSFVDDVHLSRQAYLLLASIKSMCDAIVIGSLIDGVETTAQLTALQDIGFHTYQGQLFGGPVNSKVFVDRYFPNEKKESK